MLIGVSVVEEVSKAAARFMFPDWARTSGDTAKAEHDRQADKAMVLSEGRMKAEVGDVTGLQSEKVGRLSFKDRGPAHGDVDDGECDLLADKTELLWLSLDSKTLPKITDGVTAVRTDKSKLLVLPRMLTAELGGGECGLGADEAGSLSVWDRTTAVTEAETTGLQVDSAESLRLAGKTTAETLDCFTAVHTEAGQLSVGGRMTSETGERERD